MDTLSAVLVYLKEPPKAPCQNQVTFTHGCIYDSRLRAVWREALFVDKLWKEPHKISQAFFNDSGRSNLDIWLRRKEEILLGGREKHTKMHSAGGESEKQIIQRAEDRKINNTGQVKQTNNLYFGGRERARARKISFGERGRTINM